MKYKNIGRTTKTFYGETFKPGDVKEVDGFINVRSFIRVDDSTPVTGKKNSEPKPAQKVEPEPVPEPKAVEPKKEALADSKKGADQKSTSAEVK